jgi:hypothetical protein
MTRGGIDMDDAERAKTVSWLLQPNLDAVTFVVDELKLLSTVQRSLVAMTGLPQLLTVAKLAAQEKGLGQAALSAFDTLIAESPVSFAQEYVAGDYALPNSHGLIASWGVVEACTEETVVNLFRNVGPSRLAGVDPRFAAGKATLDEAEARALYPKLERRLRDGRSVAEAYAALLSLYTISMCPARRRSMRPSLRSMNFGIASYIEAAS